MSKSTHRSGKTTRNIGPPGSPGTWDSLPEDIKRMIILEYCTGSTETQSRIIRPRITIRYTYLLKGQRARPGIKPAAKGGIITQHTLDWPHDPAADLKPLPAGFDRKARDLYEGLWPHVLRIENSRTVRFHPVRDVVYMDHNQVYNLWDFCKKYYSANGAGYGFTNGDRPRNASKFQNGYSLPQGMRYGEIEGFDKIERFSTTLETLNMQGMRELRVKRMETDRPLKSIKSVRFNWPMTPDVIFSPDMVKTVQEQALGVVFTSLSAANDQRRAGPALFATWRVREIVDDNIDYFFQQTDDGKFGTETDDDDLDTEGHTVNARVKRKKK